MHSSNVGFGRRLCVSVVAPVLLAAAGAAAQTVEVTPPGSGVSASTSDTNLPANVVDNNLATRWSGNGDGASLQLDLGTVHTVAFVRVAAYSGNARRNLFDLQTSVDGAAWSTALPGASTGGGTTAEETFDFADTPARYVRYIGHGATLNAGGTSTWNSVTEMSVFAVSAAPTPTPTATPTPTVTPTGSSPATPTPTPTATPTSTPGNPEITPPASAVTASTHDGNVPGNTVDGSLATRWSANGDGQWVRFDLGSSKTVTHVRVAFYSGNVRQSRFDLQVSADGASWTNVLTAAASNGTSTNEETFDFADTSARYVRYLGHGNSVNTWNSVTEVSIFGGDCTDCPTPVPTVTPTPTSTPTPTPRVTPPPDPSDVKYHLTARPWSALDIPDSEYLDRIEGIVRYEATLQDASGAIIDPVANQEWQYATPYFANALGVLLNYGRANDLLSKGVLAMNHVTSQMSQGNAAIPQQHGNFFVAPMADALQLYQPFVSSTQLQTWRGRMQRPIAELTKTDPHNWRSYAMKGQWARFVAGLVTRSAAVAYIEDGWVNTQRARLQSAPWHLYHDTSSDPDSFAYDAAARSNLLEMISAGYDGASAAEIEGLLRRGNRSALLLQDPTGQAAAGGRSGDHTWNDVYAGLVFQRMALREQAAGNDRLAGAFHRAASLALRSIERWRSTPGYYYVTKNRFDPSLRVRYATYSQLTNYNGNVVYHLSETLRLRGGAPAEQPAPAEIGGYAWVPDAEFATAFANAGGLQVEAGLRGSTALRFGLYWSALGITRVSRTGWDSRLGPSDGIRDAAGNGVSYAPTFLEGTTWVRLASVPDRYQATFSSSLTHPLLVRGRLSYAPKPGMTGPTFTDDLVVTPDGVLSTVTSSAGSYGVTWPLLVNDGSALTVSVGSHVASVKYPTRTDEQAYIALHASPTLTNLTNVRSSYGDLRPVRVVSGGSNVQTFIYPRSGSDPTAESVRTSFTRSGGDFSTILGRVAGSLYVGRTSAGGVGTSLDLDGDGTPDVTFSTSCGFILQLQNGVVTAVEADRAVSGVVQGRNVSLAAYSPMQF